jgi:hypothetical protein
MARQTWVHVTLGDTWHIKRGSMLSMNGNYIHYPTILTLHSTSNHHCYLRRKTNEIYFVMPDIGGNIF